MTSPGRPAPTRRWAVGGGGEVQRRAGLGCNVLTWRSGHVDKDSWACPGSVVHGAHAPPCLVCTAVRVHCAVCTLDTVWCTMRRCRRTTQPVWWTGQRRLRPGRLCCEVATDRPRADLCMQQSRTLQNSEKRSTDAQGTSTITRCSISLNGPVVRYCTADA